MGDADELREGEQSTHGRNRLTNQNEQVNLADIFLPMVEWYETIEGEGTRAGLPTVFVRVFGCNLRCVWCDTPYSYAPAKADHYLSVAAILDQLKPFQARHVCLTGGEPLMYGEKSRLLLQAIAELEQFDEIHVETNGAIDLQPFLQEISSPKVRYIMDYKLIDSGETNQMKEQNIKQLRAQDELKFVIASEADFFQAKQVLDNHPCLAQPLFSPVWESMPPHELAALILEHGLVHVRLSLQLHKIIWNQDTRRV